MARARNWWNHSKTTVILIWFISAFIFYVLFKMALRNSSQTTAATSTESPALNSELRSRLYNQMARDLDERGALFLEHGETSQSLSLSDLFTLKGGSVTPVLKPANPAVRANVLYLSPQHSVPIAEAVRNIFLPHFDKGIWFQNSSLYHFSMFHASHHVEPVPATDAEVDAEAKAVKAVADDLCPLKIVLDRVVLTSTGVLLGCWQVTAGTDPATVRAKLRTALPRAPKRQFYDAAILHSSFARLLDHPTTLSTEADRAAELHFINELVTRLNNQIHGIQATVSELWYVEEYDVLALALDGRINARKFELGCSKSGRF